MQSRDLNLFYFFREKFRSFDDFEQMSGLWSMFWFKSFRNFFRKIAIFRNFDHWSEILSMSAGRPISQGVCPPLTFMIFSWWCPLGPGKWHLPAIQFILAVRLIPILTHLSSRWTVPLRCFGSLSAVSVLRYHSIQSENLLIHFIRLLMPTFGQECYT